MNQDSKNMAILNWVLTIFFGFIPCLILYLVKTDDAYIRAHSVEALNWSITAFIGYAVATVLTIIVIGVFLFPIIGICHLIFCIMGAIAASKGDDFNVPFAIRLIK
jgi:uncharacterized Tic20 family protein